MECRGILCLAVCEIGLEWSGVWSGMLLLHQPHPPCCTGDQAQPLMDIFGADTGTASMVLLLLILNLIKGEGLHGPGRSAVCPDMRLELDACTDMPLQYET